MEKFLELNEITLLPTKKNVGMTEMNFFDGDVFPIFTAPSPEICGEYSAEYWMKNRIQSIIPKDEPLDYRLKVCPWMFSAFTPSEIEAEFLRKDRRAMGTCLRIYIDTPNALDQELLKLAFNLKGIYQDRILLMAGPVANQEAYSSYSQSGIDYMVAGSGIGAKYGFDYPLAQLLIDIERFKSTGAIGFRPIKVVADGDFTNPIDIIKAIAIGADAVMIRKGFIRVVEAEGTIYSKTQSPDGKISMDEVPNQETLMDISREDLRKAPLARLYEGKWTPVNIKLIDWVSKLKEVATYAFMMTGARTWAEFKKEIKYGRI